MLRVVVLWSLWWGRGSILCCHTGSLRRKLRIEIDVNDSSSIEEEMQGIFHKFQGLLISSIHNNNN
jgi:hypothetical protein